MNIRFINSTAKITFLLACSVSAALTLSACVQRAYTAQGYDFNRDLMLISTDEQTTRTIYLDRNSINQDQNKPNWQHATVITTYANTNEDQAKLFGASATTEVTFDCDKQMVRFDFIRTYPKNMAQGVALGTFTYDTGFVHIEHNDDEGAALLNAACLNSMP